MTTEALREFGFEVRQQRLKWKWSLEDLAAKALDNSDRKGYVSQVEKGKRNLSPETIQKFVDALDLSDEVAKAALIGPTPDPNEPELAEQTKADIDAERLLRRAENDADVPKPAEALLIALAYDHAEGPHRDLFDAYTSLRKALEAAEAIRQRGSMPDNTGGQLQAVMAEVARLNDEGNRDEAADFLDQEMKRLEQERDKLFEQQLQQDRLRNRADLAAERLIRDLYRQAPAGGVFLAADQLANKWRENDGAGGDTFALSVALEIAKANYERVKGKKTLEAAALYTLGWCHLRIAERSTNEKHLNVARNALEASVQRTNSNKEPLNWSSRQDGFGSVLAKIGERAGDPEILGKSVAAFREALAVGISIKHSDIKSIWNNLGTALQSLGEITRSKKYLSEAEESLTKALSLEKKSSDPTGWVRAQCNLALAQRHLGAVTSELAKLDEARDGFATCEALDIKDKAAFQWAKLQWNIADLALVRFNLDHDPALLIEARKYVGRAREVFFEGSDYQTQRCDELLAEIDAADAI